MPTLVRIEKRFDNECFVSLEIDDFESLLSQELLLSGSE